MRPLDESVRRALIYSGDGDAERCGQHECAELVTAETDLGDNFDIIVGKVMICLASDVQKRIFKAGCIAASEELLGICGAALTAKLRWKRQLEVENAIFAFDEAVSSTTGSNCGQV
jgi:hypothetical protein